MAARVGAVGTEEPFVAVDLLVVEPLEKQAKGAAASADDDGVGDEGLLRATPRVRVSLQHRRARLELERPYQVAFGRFRQLRKAIGDQHNVEHDARAGERADGAVDFRPDLVVKADNDRGARRRGRKVRDTRDRPSLPKEAASHMLGHDRPSGPHERLPV